MVLQDTWIFTGTIAENIAYGKPDASREEIVRVAKLAMADHFIRTLPLGYDTMLKNGADDLSQGQRQLLTIARAFLINPSILVLDEATANVDTRTEVEVQKAMNQLLKGRTGIVIAHRLSTIRDADFLLVVNQGRSSNKGLTANSWPAAVIIKNCMKITPKAWRYRRSPSRPQKNGTCSQVHLPGDSPVLSLF